MSSPEVEWIEPTVARWTFDTEDREKQQRQFSYWCGWFGFDEDELPDHIEGSVWFFRHPDPGQQKRPGLH